MQAAVYYGVGDVPMDIPEPRLASEQVQVWAPNNDTCRSDLTAHFSALTFIPLEPDLRPGPRTPVILGREFTAEDLGEGVTRIKLGQRAALQPTYSCGPWIATNSPLVTG